MSKELINYFLKMSIRDFIIRSSETGSATRFQPHMFSNIKDWKDKDLQFWEGILEEIRDRPMCLYIYIPFTYKFLGINLLDQFFQYQDISQQTINYVKNSLEEKYRWLYLTKMEINIIKKEDFNIFNILIDIKNNLILQGATTVEELYLSEDNPIKVKRDIYFHELSLSLSN
ncbi:MAG: hypothetical protein AAFQ94_18860 [Bacteroidota bacterium]